MKRITVSVLLFCSAIVVYSQSNIATLSLFFEKGSYDLSLENKQKIEKFLAFVSDSSYSKVLIKGFADADGTNTANMQLSEMRVNAVRNHLNASGYTNVHEKYYGEEYAAKTNAEEKKIIDRRVDIVFCNTYNLGNKKEPQIFYFKPNRDIVFTAAEGTLIKIPANSLVFESGLLPGDEIKIEITEYYSEEDIIKNKLTTTSNGELLISAGMINIEASRNEKPLELKAGRSMEVGFADRTEGDGFGMFYGTENTENGTVNWTPAADAAKFQSGWDFSSITYFESDTLSIERGKFALNEKGQTIRVKQFWKKFNNSYSYDTVIIDKKIYTNNILLNATKLGWLNCDKFYEENVKTDILVNIDAGLEADVVLIFKDFKSMLAPVRVNNKQIKFADIPLGQEVILTGVASDGEKLFFTKQELISGPEIIYLKFAESTVAEIDNSFAAL